MTSAPQAKWFDSLPTPISSPAQLSVQDLHDFLHSGGDSANVLVVDVRRADIEVSNSHTRCSQDLTRQG